MLVKKYRSELVAINNSIDGLFTLEFKSLSGRYKYHPGQFLHLSLESDYDGTGQWPDSRCFSIQSSPSEINLRISYTAKGKFTRQMEQLLNLGSIVWLKLPYGDLFTQIHNKINTIFIAGGTGITPFLSLFTDSSFSSYINPFIYAGFRNEKMNVYQSELRRANEINTKLEIRIKYQDREGLLNIDEIYQMSDKKSSFFISGPPLMIVSFKKYLLKNGISETKIHTDDWE